MEGTWQPNIDRSLCIVCLIAYIQWTLQKALDLNALKSEIMLTVANDLWHKVL